MAHSAEAK